MGEWAPAVEGLTGEIGGSEWERALDRLRGTLGRDRNLEGSLVAQEVQRRSLNPAGDGALQYLMRRDAKRVRSVADDPR